MSKPSSGPLVLPFGAFSPQATATAARPTNVARSTVHIGAGLLSLALVRLLPGRGWLLAAACAFAVAAWSMEVSRIRSEAVNDRLMRFFGPIAHPNERFRVNSSTWYVTALVLLAAFAPMAASELAVLVLAFADPAAGVVGRRFGRTRLRAGRSLEGTLGFVAVGALVSFVWLIAARGTAAPTAMLIALVAGVTGALAELGSTRLDDNFSIPIAVGVTVGLVSVGL